MSKPNSSYPKWIWSPLLSENQENQYVEFRLEFDLETAPETACLRISVDTNFAAWMNGEFIDCGQFGDFPDARTFSTLDLSDYLQPGRNILAILVHYCGVDHFSYYPGDAGLWYELEVDGGVLAASDDRMQCRISPCYLQEESARFNPQMGFTFHFDASRDDGWRKREYCCNETWQSAFITSQREVPRPRPLPMLAIGSPSTSSIMAQGLIKRDSRPGQTVAEQMQLDFMSARRSWELFDDFSPVSSPAALPVRLSDANLEGADGFYVILDLGREECGFPSLDLHSADGCVIDIAVGEHLDDLRVRSSIGGRNFASRYVACPGDQNFTEYLHRYAGRYVQLHITQQSGALELRYAGIIPADYPVTPAGEFNSSDSLCDRIWSVSRRTLHLCMHEHYEDCPWREQALYANDSRNQMLCGYYAFEGYDFARVSLDLLSRTTGADGYQELCAPMKHDLTIPSFTMTWFLAMNDYLMYSGDKKFVAGKFPLMKRMIEGYLKEVNDGLLPCPPGKRYWHFYDWAPGLDGTMDEDCTKFSTVEGVRFDAPFNFLFVMALQSAANVAGWIGEEDVASQWLERVEQIKVAAHDTFWDGDRSAYRSYAGDRANLHFAELTQSLAILAGAGTDGIHRDLRETLMRDENGLTTTTLSQSLYKFEAILLDESCGPFVLNAIKRDWSQMLFAGATSFWETLRGGWDFHHAGSLCHGWSGIPVYFYGAYGLGIKPLAPGFSRIQVKPLLGMEGLKGRVPGGTEVIGVTLENVDDSYVAHLQIPETADVVVDRARVREINRNDSSSC
jgi:hypothetical protein